MPLNGASARSHPRQAAASGPCAEGRERVVSKKKKDKKTAAGINGTSPFS